MKFTPIRQACRLAVCGLVFSPLFGYAAGGAMTPGAESQMLPQNPGVAPYVAPANVFVPESSRPQGQNAHTNYVIRNVNGIQANSISDLALPAPDGNPLPDATYAEYPSSLACLYGMSVKPYAGCKPANMGSAYNAKGGNRAIAIVDAYHYPTAYTDQLYFANFFGLNNNFTKVIADNGCGVPPVNAGWNLEAALDIEWAHAMAPGAKIILVETCSNSYTDLMYGEQVAEAQVNNYGGGQVSNSWSSGEFSTESTDWDWVFRANWQSGKPIAFFFSAGDAGLGAEYPSSSPWVVSVGGTTVNRDASANFTSESCWAGSGGGTSLYETYSSTFGSGTGPWTNYQYPHFGQSARRTPDVAADADPASGAWVYYNGGWYVVGGTSLSAPMWAGIANNANNRMGVAPSGGGYYTNEENNLVYATLDTYNEYPKRFYDVTTGSNGAAAGPGWDYCTGVGSPRGKNNK